MNLYSDLPDAALVKRLNEQDNTAFAVIYERYWYALYRHARLMLKDEELARDVVQDVFTSLLTNKVSNYPNISLKSFLYSCLKNRIYNMIRREKIEAKYLDSLRTYIPPDGLIADRRILEKELIEQIEAEISALPPKMRTVFELSHKNDLTADEIAKAISGNRHTVLKQIREAIKKLRSKLNPHFMLSGISLSITLSKFLQ
jgi:RNA polymerase sigma-70 factor (ECF subfamily)